MSDPESVVIAKGKATQDAIDACDLIALPIIWQGIFVRGEFTQFQTNLLTMVTIRI